MKKDERIIFAIESTLKADIERKAGLTGLSLSAYIRQLIRKDLTNNDNDNEILPRVPKLKTTTSR